MTSNDFHMICADLHLTTLTYLIIVQDVINVQAGKFPGINKRAGCNKAVQVGIFQESIVKKTCRLENFQKLINVQDVIRPCRLDFFKKIIKRAACLLDRLEYVLRTIYLI